MSDGLQDTPNDADTPALVYPFDATPPPGGNIEVAHGVHWLRLPLPYALDHINVWAIDDGDGWALVDTGVRTEQTAEVWRRLMAQAARQSGGTKGLALLEERAPRHHHAAPVLADFEHQQLELLTHEGREIRGVRQVDLRCRAEGAGAAYRHLEAALHGALHLAADRRGHHRLSPVFKRMIFSRLFTSRSTIALHGMLRRG